MTAAHYVAFRLGAVIPYKRAGVSNSPLKDYSESAEQFLEALNTSSLRDHCVCACSLGGCLPITMMLKKWIDSRAIHERYILYNTNLLWRDAEHHALHLQWAWLERDILRFSTFSELDLR